MHQDISAPKCDSPWLRFETTYARVCQTLALVVSPCLQSVMERRSKMAQSPLATTCGVWRVAALLVFLSLACPAPALVMPSLRFADGIPKATKLSPMTVRLRTAVLRKSASAANMTEQALASRPRRRVARLVRAAGVKLAPNDASDLIDSIPTQWSARKRRLAVELVLAFAEHGIVVRRGTFYSLVGACRKSRRALAGRGARLSAARVRSRRQPKRLQRLDEGFMCGRPSGGRCASRGVDACRGRAAIE